MAEPSWSDLENMADRIHAKMKEAFHLLQLAKSKDKAGYFIIRTDTYRELQAAADVLNWVDAVLEGDEYPDPMVRYVNAIEKALYGH